MKNGSKANDIMDWLCGESKPDSSIDTTLMKTKTVFSDIFDENTEQPISAPKSSSAVIRPKQKVGEDVVIVGSQEQLEEAIISAGGYLDGGVDNGFTVSDSDKSKAEEAIKILTQASVALQEENISDIFDEKDGNTTLKFIESHDHLETILPMEDDEEE